MALAMQVILIFMMVEALGLSASAATLVGDPSLGLSSNTLDQSG